MKRIVRDKKKVAAFLLGLSFIAAGASFAVPSLAWLAKAQTTAKLDGLEGEAHGSYFNGGDGSAEHPFEIDNARQLYYFNWLQDLGYFNAPNDDKSGIDQTYFILTSDIDASDYVLPPAGTEEYPFVGNFDGNGKTISGVTITNNYSELKNPPVGAKADSNGILNQAEIVGFFGVVGSTTTDAKVNDYTYDSSALEIKNLGISGATIQSASSETLVGLAAGYVNGTLSGVGVDSSSIATKTDAEAITDISGVKSISEYSLVGYATEAYRSTTQVNDETMSMPQIENPNTDHGSTNWGGSVDMKQMYNDLKSERDDSSISSNVYWASSATIDVDPNGVESNPTITKNSSYYVRRYDGTSGWSGSTSNTNYNKTYFYFKNGQRTDSDGKVVASYGLTYHSTSSDSYIYIYGTPSTTPTYSSRTTSITRNYYGYPTTISKDGHYLKATTSGVSDTTTASQASSWTVPSSGKSGNVFTTINSTVYYLNVSSGSLSLSTSASTSWTYDAEKGNLYYSASSSQSYYLVYNSGWTLQSVSANTYLVIRDQSQGNVYVGYSGTSGSSPLASTAYNSSNYAWGYSSTDNAYYPLSDSSVYLGIKSTNWTQTAQIATNSGKDTYSSYTRFHLENASSDGTGTGLILTDTFDGSVSYFAYDSGSFQVSYKTNSGANYNLPDQRDTFVIEKVSDADLAVGLTIETSSEQSIVKTSTSSENAITSINPTYVPLAYSYSSTNSTTGLKSGITGVSDMNTGYLVGGANYINTNDYAGDIRVAAAYQISGLYTSFNKDSSSTETYSSANAQVLTYSNTEKSDGTYSNEGWSRVKDNYNKDNISSYDSSSLSSFSNTVSSSSLKRYDNARRNLQYTIWGSYDNKSIAYNSSLYGLHFMNPSDGSISTKRLAKVGKAVVYDKAAEKVYEEQLKKYMNKEITEKPTQTGSVYYDYEVPEDSIDFNLATSGYINFFGATYYVNSGSATTTNSSFFSLNEITRDSSNKITAIKEISKIYANTGDDKKTTPYIYEYSDGTTSGTLPSSSYLAFNTDWITDPEMVHYCLYYFEIPVNAGEYALGPVAGEPGAYLLYLDIGTAAADYEAVTITEKVVSEITRQSYPLGVDFTSSFKNLSSITGGTSACIAVLVAPAKKIDYDYEGTALSVTPVSNIKAVFLGDGVTVSGSDGSEIESAVATPLTITMERTTLQSYSPTNYIVSLSYSCTWTISGASVDDEIQLYFLSNSATWTSGDSSKATVADGLVTVKGEGDFTITAEGAGEKQSDADWKGPDQITTEATFGELKLSLTGGNASVEYVYDEDNKTYKVTVHCDVDVTVKVISIPSDSDYVITVNDTKVTAKDRVITVKANSSN